ncbi:ABC transporter ATP-binding protein [Defluviitalea phaphyphila]|uniref:ABC transporter ATP-binding protein n=1 Tax=Defluviitalea phaphyphila TaxID=1473580 RepID=UPI000730C737|nr:ABC transporter ATP-binding protein [Defluviitalea phaphyphila]
MRELLVMKNITKKFGDIYANKDINLIIREGEVHTLLGENGAGKSTLMNILIGLYQPTSGSIYYRGKKVKIDSPSKAMKLGIGMVHQHFMLVEAMTVFENIILGVTKDSSIFIKKDRIKKDILELASKYGLNVEIDKPITEISVGEQQRVEILKALYRGAELLILDEPTAALTDIEVEGLFRVIKKLISEKKSVVFISHKMREVLEISDRITILRMGHTIKTLDKNKTNAEELAALMIGKKMVSSKYKKVSKTKENIIALEHISFNKESKHNGIKDISLTVGKGEILGIAGVDGNGQSQLAQVVTGVITPHEGNIYLYGKKVAQFDPNDFINSNISHIPEDRNKMGLIGDMSVKENLILKSIEKSKFSLKKGLFLKKKIINQYSNEMKKKYDIRCSSIDQEVRNLSGGNQQKIVLARELEMEPELLVAVHPTRGLDIGATKYVHDKIISARDKGCGVILISADFDEILKLSDRIAVMFEGQIVGIYSGDNPPIDEISLAMAGKAE